MKKWELSRRTFLRGMGYTMALPLLEAMIPSRAWAQALPVRFVGVYFGNGIFPETWYPTGTGVNWQPSIAMQPLAAVKQHLTVLRGIRNDGVDLAYSFDGGVAHWGASSSFLTGQCYDYDLRRARTALRIAGASLDQLYGATMPTRLKSLIMGSGAEDALGNADDRGFGTFLTHISYKQSNRTSDSATAIDQMLDRHASSAAVFQALFGSGPVPAPTTGSNAEILKPQFRKNILHYVNEDIKRVRSNLGAADQARLDQFLTQVEEVERRIAVTEPIVISPTCAATSGQITLFNQDSVPSNGNDMTQRVMNMADLMILALKCDMTRSVSFMLENEHSYGNLINKSWNKLPAIPGVTYSSYLHHDASHYLANDTINRKAVMTEFNKWQCGVLAVLINKLEAEREADKSLLDQTLLMFGSGLSNSDAHSTVDIPVILAGRAGGALTPGQLIQTNGAKHSNLLLTLARKLGLNIPSIGLSNGTISGI